MSLIYLSFVEQTTWSIAESDCNFFFGANSTLVAIESVEEWDFLKIKLESYGRKTIQRLRFYVKAYLLIRIGLLDGWNVFSPKQPIRMVSQ